MKEAFTDYNPRASTLAMIDQANEILEDYDAQGFVLSVRQLYYQFVARDLLANTQANYNRLAGIVCDAREGGLLDWSYIEDRGRNLESLALWRSPGSIVEACVRSYRRDRWAEQPQRVEVWVEKDALLGVIEQGVQGLDVPFMSCRGYPSVSMIYEASLRLDGAIVLHLGDHDPSGIDATRSISDKLDLYGNDSEVRRIALTWEQVQAYNPPPNPAKATDSRFMGYVAEYGSECWELDALEPQVIVDLIQNEVKALIDPEAWDAVVEREETERDLLRQAAASLDGR
jgi:hypothetical protein